MLYIKNSNVCCTVARYSNWVDFLTDCMTFGRLKGHEVKLSLSIYLYQAYTVTEE